LSQFKTYHTSENLKFNNSGFFQSLKLRILVEKIIPISLNLNFTLNALGCYGLILDKKTPLTNSSVKLTNLFPAASKVTHLSKFSAFVFH